MHEHLDPSTADRTGETTTELLGRGAGSAPVASVAFATASARVVD